MGSSSLTRRRLILGASALLLAGAAGLGGYVVKRRIQRARRQREREASRWESQRRVPEPPPGWPERTATLHAALAAGRLGEAAVAAGHLTDEALTRASRVVEAWLDGRAGELLTRRIDSGTPDDTLWNYKDCAADLYCHFVIQTLLFSPENRGEMTERLAAERALTDGLPCAARIDSGALVSQDVDERIFGAVEYAKDGLLPILERCGETEWLPRLREVVDAVVAASPVETRHGRIPSQGTEKNGEMLQVLARLWHRDRRPEHLVAGRAIAGAYVHDVLPAGDGLPAQEWSFAEGRAVEDEFELRDHGNEIVSGLVEWLIVEQAAPDGREAAHRPAIERMIDLLLERGRDTAGMWLEEVEDPEDLPRPPAPAPENDNWGYLAAACVAHALALPEGSPRREQMLAEAARARDAAIGHRAAAWRGGMDGYADSIEGMLYLLPWIGTGQAEQWVDEQTGILLAHQQPDGFVGRTYLDGNYVRTALLYSLFRTGGARLDPWEPGVRLGAVRGPEGLHLAVSSARAWSGRVVFDTPRHREHLRLPFDYPRLNSWTEWFPVERERNYMAVVADSEQIMPGSALVEGLPLELTAGDTVHLEIRHAG